jgi:hypothetical protein
MQNATLNPACLITPRTTSGFPCFPFCVQPPPSRISAPGAVRQGNSRLLGNDSRKRLDATREQLENLGSSYVANALSNKLAAQIFAEMLGVVCHRDYLKTGNKWYMPFDLSYGWQVFVVNLSGLKVSFYWARFPPEYLDTIRNSTCWGKFASHPYTAKHDLARSTGNEDNRSGSSSARGFCGGDSGWHRHGRVKTLKGLQTDSLGPFDVVE